MYSSTKPLPFTAAALSFVVIAQLAIAPPLRALDSHRLISQYGLRVWQTSDGLPQNSGLAIAQDRQGYVWVGTEEGLVRYDGVRFVTFDERNTPELPNPYIYSLALDSGGDLWVGTADGLLRRHGDRFVRYTMRDDLPANRIIDLVAAPDGTLWIGTDLGLTHYFAGRFHNIGWSSGLGRLMCLVRDHLGTVWIGTRTGLARLVDGRIEDVPFPESARGTTVRTLRETRDGTLWIGTTAGLFRWRGTIEKVTSPEIDGVTARTMREDSDGNLWIGTINAGLLRYRDGRFDRFAVGKGLAMPWVVSLFEDRDRNLWIGTGGGGVLQMRDTVILPFGPPEGIPGDATHAIADDGHGVMWFATREGLTRYDGRSFRTYTTRDGLPENFVMGLTIDHTGTVWASTPGTGLNSIRGDVVTRFTTRDGLPSNLVAAVAEDALGSLWFLTDKGLARRRAGRIETFTANVGYVSGPIYAMSPAPDGSMYFGIGRGSVTRFSGERFTTTLLPPHLADARINDIVIDRDGTLWLALDGKGLVQIRGKRFTQFTTASGLYDGKVFALADDGKGFFWMTSNRGIARVSRRELFDVAEHRIARVTPRVFGVDDGMRTQECNWGRRGGAVVSTDGRVWVMTGRGFVCIDPRLRERRATPAAARIESVKADGELATGPSWNIRAGTQRVEIAYTALQFTTPGAVRFRAMLEGVDSDWVDVGARRTAFYTKLSPGTHRFRVMASSDGSNWSSPAVMSIVQAPRFYQTSWFALLAAAAVAALLWLAYRLRIRAMRRREAELVRLVDTRTTELGGANRELLSTNTLLEAARAKNQLLLDSAAEGIFGLDDGGVVTFVNRACSQILGWSAEAFVGAQLHPLVHAGSPQQLAAEEHCPICRPDENTPSTGAVSLRRHDGRLVPVEYNTNVILDGDRARVGIVVTFHDITERLAIEQMKDELVATVSHELKTPLTSIRGALGLLGSGKIAALDAKAERILQIALTNSDRLLRLVNDLLDLERISSGTLELQRSDVDAGTLLQQAVDVMQAMGDGAGVRVEANPLTARIFVDGDRILQTLTNLISNAIKFSPRDGVVRVSGEQHDDRVVLRVTDQGRGIPADKIALVFERFQQVEKDDAKKKGGSGLGLAICRSIVESHGGKIGVESEFGRGSTFWIELPAPDSALAA